MATYPNKKIPPKTKLGAIAGMFGGLTEKAMNSLKGLEQDPKTKELKKTKRQKLLDET